MVKFEVFKKYLLEQVANGSIYLWGGQGEDLKKLTDEYIEKKETSKANADKVKALRDKNKVKHPDLRAYDCSGLFVYFGLQNKLIESDMTANTIYKKCALTDKDHLIGGDFVFRWNKAKTKIEHIGYYIGNGEVVHSKGRAYGVVREPLEKSTWDAFGISNWVEHEESDFEFTENLYYAKCSGFVREDVKELQKLLLAKGYDLGEHGVDGEFGRKTRDAVLLFQRASHIGVDGIAGKKTIEKLGGKYVKK